MANYECNATACVRITHHFRSFVVCRSSVCAFCLLSLSLLYPLTLPRQQSNDQREVVWVDCLHIFTLGSVESSSISLPSSHLVLCCFCVLGRFPNPSAAMYGLTRPPSLCGNSIQPYLSLLSSSLSLLSLSCSYGATKAFVSEFAASIAPELRCVIILLFLRN
jgi:hypothetical protein